MKFRQKPTIVDASPWFKNGDHPLDYAHDRQEFDVENGTTLTIKAEFARLHDWEGEVVRRFRIPSLPISPPPHIPGQVVGGGSGLTTKCPLCGIILHNHGWIDSGGGGQTVCPGDYVITDAFGRYSVMRPKVFAICFEPAEIVPSPGPVVLAPAATATLEPISPSARE
jgi:hypothetical protein